MKRRIAAVSLIAISILVISGCSDTRNSTLEDNIEKVEEYYSEQSMSNPYSEDDLEIIKESMKEAINGYDSYSEQGEVYICNGAITMQLKNSETWYMFIGDILKDSDNEYYVSNVTRFQLYR